ncbi:MAG: hypothetical protein KAJ55_09205 [Anaerolineales bacterium]|nr:hypothetical protein [Anaerolineales bacterium]
MHPQRLLLQPALQEVINQHLRRTGAGARGAAQAGRKFSVNLDCQAQRRECGVFWRPLSGLPGGSENTTLAGWCWGLFFAVAFPTGRSGPTFEPHDRLPGAAEWMAGTPLVI